MNVIDPKILVDHVDGNGLNNQKHNLRIATRSQNLMNRSKRGGMFKYKGVRWHKDRNKWRAFITLNKRSMCLGAFEQELDAVKAYNDAAIKYFGEFARLNVLPLEEVTSVTRE